MINQWPELNEEFKQDYMRRLSSFLTKARQSFQIYPPPSKVFDALERTPFKNVKVVILGQDPYHNGQAVGRSFAVESNPLPPSLVRILQASKSEDRGDLISWSEQGVLLLNTILTVEKGKPLSHENIGWETFTLKIIDLLNAKEQPLVFLLWGSKAKSYSKYINHHIVYAEHPVAGVYRGSPWNYEDCFNRANSFLQEKIIW